MQSAEYAAPPKVLLVEDEDILRAAFARILTRSGFAVEAFGSGGAALEVLQQRSNFDAIITDLEMPGMNGIELLRFVRRLDEDVPLIVVTGNPSLMSAISTVELGGFRYLLKPINPDELRDTVRSATAMHRLSMLKRHALRICENEGWGAGERVGLEIRFRSALERLWMAYQPIVDWSAGNVYGYEALVRSSEPSLSSPSLLLDAAKKLGMTSELGRKIRELVTERMTAAPPDAALFVNLQAADLNDPELYDAGAPLSACAERVVLEITERHSLDDVLEVRKRTSRLRELGFRIAIDDLGSGYSGLSSFGQLEPEIVKLDMSLTRGIDTSRAKQSLVRSMLSVCENELGTVAICEGVETLEERETLVQLGASLFQGYFFARPDREFLTPGYCGLPNAAVR